MDINYTKEDYIATTAPYEEVERCSNPFEKEQKIAQLADHARSVGVRNFMTLHKKYVKSMQMLAKSDFVENASNFTGQELELDTGSWLADDYGISRPGVQGEEIACAHPLMPVQRLTNIDTGIEKLKLAFKRGGMWKTVVCDRKQVASNNTIVGLADFGISVTSENARHMVRYLQDVENLNYDRIPQRKSVSRLGWVGEEGFSPYMEGIVFDGENGFRDFFDSVGEKGSMDIWLEEVKKIRQSKRLVPKIVLAASFASVLVGPCGGLPFFCHLWGKSGTGKTVGLVLATSVWANPEKGRYWQSFNSTAVAQELSASFVNSLPLILDELQIIKDKKDFDQMIYQLSEGVGKARGQKTGGLQKVGTWSNCIISTGEQPISSSASGGGAVNRVIEIRCNEKLFENPAHLCKVLKANYGHAGKRFVELMSDPEMMENASQVQSVFFKAANKKATEKQALAASLILTADFLINEYIFHDGQCLSVDDLQQFLSDKDEVSQEKRAHEWLLGWIVQNRNKFLSKDNMHVMECYGRIDDDSVSIIRNVFNQACVENGYNPTSFATWMRDHGLTETENNEKRLDKLRRINGSPCRCIVLKAEEESLCGFIPVDTQIEF